MNGIGLSAALAAFFGIWIGHIAVRRVEAAAPRLWIPMVIAVVLGLCAEYLSVWTRSASGSVAWGTIGITVLWDAFELFRQEKRIRNGHAPANPANPRHARLLAEYVSATSLDLLKREPTAIPSASGLRGG